MWLEVEEWRQGNERKPDIREDSSKVGNVGVVSSNVSSSEGFLRSASEGHHRPINEIVHDLRSSHVGGPVRSGVHNFFLADDVEEVEEQERNEPDFNVIKEVGVEDVVHGNREEEGCDELDALVEVDLSHGSSSVFLAVVSSDPLGEVLEVFVVHFSKNSLLKTLEVIFVILDDSSSRSKLEVFILLLA